MRQPEKAGPKQPESKLDVLARAHGVTRDVAERYLMACDDKIGDAHKMLQASRASRCHSAVQDPSCMYAIEPCGRPLLAAPTPAHRLMGIMEGLQ